jgi:hypothetical protein
MRKLKSFFAVLTLGYALFGTAPAWAFVACNKDGDCWRTGSKIQWSGVILTFHDDSWWDTHKADAQYHGHDADAQHDWQTGYWREGEWNKAF